MLSRIFCHFSFRFFLRNKIDFLFKNSYFFLLFLTLFAMNQLYALRRLMQGTSEHPKAPLGNNARPVQNLHHRTVRTNIDFKQSKVWLNFLLSSKKKDVILFIVIDPFYNVLQINMAFSSAAIVHIAIFVWCWNFNYNLYLVSNLMRYTFRKWTEQQYHFMIPFFLHL